MRTSSIDPVALPRDAVAPLSATARQLHPLKRLTAWIRNKRRIHRGMKELMALDDRMLADIGLTRAQVEHAARRGRPFGEASRLSLL
jgi:uncharacterized protein YjiS (DUF1127 family)